MAFVTPRHGALSDRHQQLARGTELKHLVERDVGYPYVVMGIDRQTVRHREHPGPPLPQHLAARAIENNDGWARNQSRGKGLLPRSPCAMKHEDTTVRVDIHPDRQPENFALRKCGPAVNYLILRSLPGQRIRSSSRRCRDSSEDCCQNKMASHVSP